MRRLALPIAVVVALTAGGVAAVELGGRERRPSAVPPLKTPRLRALWEHDSTATQAAPDDEFAPSEEDAPTLNVLTAGGTPEEPSRRDLEAAMDKVRQRVEECRSLEQLAGIVQVRVVIDRSGSVKSARALPPLDESETGQCVAKEVHHASFPRFRGTLTPTVELTYPFYFRPRDN